MSWKKWSFRFSEETGKQPPPPCEGIANKAFQTDPQLTNFTIETAHAGKQSSRSNGWDIDEHRITLTELLTRFRTNVDKGLNSETVKNNLFKYGPNKIFPPKKKSELIKLAKSCLLGMNMLFWICGLTSIICFLAQFLYMDLAEIAYDNLWSGLGLLVIVFVAGCFQYYQEFKSSKIMASFKNMIPAFAMVIREGQRMEINVEELVVGDIVEIKYGDRVPADMRIIECSSLKVDNSSLTGEGDPQKRDILCTDKNPMETRNIVFFSTNVIEGSGKGIVIRVGEGTFMGRLALLATSLNATDTPIAREVKHIIFFMTASSLTFGVIFFAIGLSIHYTFINSMFFAIGIIISNVPESLNVTLTIILALTAKKMAEKNCLVKHLHAVETLGSASVICSDKTGTLTQNKMSVAHLWFNGDIVDRDTGKFKQSGLQYESNDPGFAALSMIAMLCSRAKFIPHQNDVPIIKRLFEGDSSEGAILKFMEEQIGQVESRRKGYPKVFEIPFTSRNKYQVSIHETSNPVDPRYFLAMKGAPEMVIQMCTTILIGNTEYDLTDDLRSKIDAAYATFGQLGERVLGFCDCLLPESKFPKTYSFDSDNPEFLKVGFRFVGLMSMIDAPRPAVPDAVAKCRQAGIKVVMVTGDHPITATAIGRAVGIISQGSQTIQEIALERKVDICDLDPRLAKAAVITGARLGDMVGDELEHLLRNHDEIIFARSIGNVVAVTGDGVNDAPALKRADIGIAMGVTGTDVAKEVADMILLDDNFASIVTSVEDGRRMFDNLRKLFRYVMADNIAEMYCYWAFVFFNIPLPMATIPMLLTTSGTDIFPAVSLAYESSESDIMKLKPRDQKKEHLVTIAALSYAYGQIGVVETFSGFMGYFWVYALNGWYPGRLIGIQGKFDTININDLEDSLGQEWSYTARQNLQQLAQTAFFMGLVMMQFVGLICCKCRRVSIFDKKITNHVMNVALLWAPIMACIFVYTPGLNDMVNLSPLSWQVYLSLIPFMFVQFFYDELRRLALRRFPGGWVTTEFCA